MSSLVVVTLNLLHGAPLPAARAARSSLMARLDWVTEELARICPDVVLLQEASRGAHHDNTAMLLARRLGMAWTYAHANPAWLWRLGGGIGKLAPSLEFEEGAAILSRLPILECHVHRLSRISFVERRIALEAVLRGPDGPFSVFTVHLTARSTAARRRQITAILRAVGSSPHHHPSIVGGDFNADEHSHEIQLLTDARGWIDSFREIHPEKAGHTCGQALSAATATAARRIDFLFSVPAGGRSWQPTQSRLILDGAFPARSDGVLWASDHYGVLARFALTPLERSPRTDAPPAEAAAPADPRAKPSPLLAWELLPPHRARAVALLAEATGRPPDDDWHRLPDLVRARHAGRLRAIIGYGSWYAPGLRKPSSFPDAYAVVDEYGRFHASAFHAWMNRRLPPHVRFVWDETGSARSLVGKYNAIDPADLARECGPALRDIYNAGRLTKLVWIAWTESDEVRSWLLDRLTDANQTMTALVLGLLPARFSGESFSLELLGASYRAEARLEGWEKIRALRSAHAPFYDEMHQILLDGFATATGLLSTEGGFYVKRSDPAWDELRSAAHLVLRRSRRRAYLRWARIVLTEPNLADLAANEAERKAGVPVRLTPSLRRHPLVFGLPEFLRVLRERNTRERIHRTRRP